MKNVRTTINKVFFSSLVFCFLAMAGSASATLTLQNGSFEIPVTPASNYIEFPALTNWTVTGSTYWASFMGSRGGFPPVDGSQELYLYGGTLQQDLGVMAAGETYTVTFSAGINPGMTAIYSEVVLVDVDLNNARLAAKNLGDVITGNTASQWFNGFVSFSTDTYPWVAGHHIAVQVNSGTQLHLDNFAVATVPEPATMALLGIGSLIFARKRLA
jgi:hypothetical protein